ncbi:helix-turn-helix domain-containing protein [Comamonas guangdongensis]|uniref:Helix-turn-helix domain-containing protein n=1 Tax=Comamonas guangdongensis TaxID=510515 RepID=A0ABV3ZVG5_9BURK
MSDSAVEEVTMQSEEQARVTAGAMLRQAREAVHVQLPSLAATLKVPQHKLEALETDDYAAFPDHVFMRALAMGMCRALHIDSAPVLALLPRTQLKSLEGSGPGINEAVKERISFKAKGTPLDSRAGGSRKIAAGVLILLAAAAAVYFVPFHQAVDSASDAVAGQSAGAAALPASASGTVVESGAAVPMGAASNSGDAPEAASAEAAPAVPATPVAAAAPVAASGPAAAAVGGTGDAAAPAPAPNAAAAPVPAAAPASGAVLALKASGQSWVKVKDANGKVVLEKTLAKDESVTAEGLLPLSVIVGNAKGTQVLVRGEPLNISTTRDNVARFEVK